MTPRPPCRGVNHFLCLDSRDYKPDRTRRKEDAGVHTVDIPVVQSLNEKYDSHRCP